MTNAELEKLVEEQKAEIEKLTADVAAYEEKLDALSGRIDVLENAPAVEVAKASIDEAIDDRFAELERRAGIR